MFKKKEEEEEEEEKKEEEEEEEEEETTFSPEVKLTCHNTQSSKTYIIHSPKI